MTKLFLQFPDYHLSHLIYDGEKTVVYQGRRKQDEVPVVVKFSKKEYPSFSELVQFRNQFMIAATLQLPGVVKPLALLPHQNSYALVMADDGSISLAHYANYQPLNLDVFFPLALQLADILHGLYQNQVIHKDIKPANILIHPTTQTLKLIDFSIASLLPKETLELQNPNILEGTLAYLSPEQTGRMNRGIDYRSDFYSLGVTFYELLTGQLPFTTEDPMELVHCHIAKQPTPPHQVQPDSLVIPQTVAAIIMKLMAKNAEDRYQSALGLKHDLEECWHQWQTTHQINTFILGKKDTCDRFVIPEKLYGREAEVSLLFKAFERVAAGHTELMLVAGFSGIGKTAVVSEVHKPIVRQRGYFISGKFDQLQRNIPFSAFVQAFRELISNLLGETEEQLTQWQRKILEALGENGQAIIEVIPQLECIIGQQPPVATLSGSATENRFNLLFLRFIQVFTTAEHPLVIFLDDLQWADSASLKLIQLLMTETDSGYLLLIAAYRDNEVSATHPLMATLEEIQKAAATVHTITLAPLSQPTLNHLIADSLSCPPALAQPLTDLVYQKTRGNPFFSNQFLKALQADGWIQFNLELGYWQCDLAQVRALALTDDVVEFMASQLQKLPPPTQNLLKLAACIGNQFSLETLAIVSELPAAEVSIHLWRALKEGLVIPLNDVYKFYQAQISSEMDNLSSLMSDHCVYRFLHDRVQQAAYFLIPEFDKKLTHFKIGQLLLQNTPETEQEEQIFAIVNQLNYGVEFITALDRRYELVQLNLIAGKKAKAASAYGAAVSYLQQALGLLSPDSWEHQYALTLTLYIEAIEATYLHTNFEESTFLAEIVLKEAKNLLDRVRVYELQMQICVAQLQSLKAIEMGLKVLEMLGITLESNIPRDLDVAALAGLQEMQEPTALAAMRILMGLISSAYFANPALLPQIIFTTIHLSLQYGNSPYSAYGYVLYGLLLCGPFADIEVGYRYGQLALDVLEKFDSKDIKTRVFLVFNGNVRHWKEHTKTTLAPLKEAIQIGLEVGAIEYAGYVSTNYCDQAFAISKPLDTLEREREQYVDLMVRLKQEYTINNQSMGLQLIQNLLGKSENPIHLVGDAFDEVKMVPIFEATQNATLLFNFYLSKGRLLYWFDQPQDAVKYLQLAAAYINSVAGMVTVGERNFYESLALLSLDYAPKSEDNNFQKCWAQIETNQTQMKYWATCAPANYQHKYDLIEAEKSRILGQYLPAIEYYEQAIAGANANEYLQEGSLANELAARFYLDWGKTKIAQTYLIEAYYGYARWGAKAKVHQLEQKYPQLLAPVLRQNALENLTAINTYTQRTVNHNSRESAALLDYGTILKAARSISREIELDKLLSTLMQVVIENAGAQTGTLIWHHHQNWMIIAQGCYSLTENFAKIDSWQPLDANTLVPHSLIYYVIRTQETLVLDHAAQYSQFANEVYLQTQKPQSVLCMPILQQGKLSGILYLENQLTAGAFTYDRLEVLNLLTAQAAISLENSLLYQHLQEYSQTLEQKVEERTQQLNQKNQRLIQTLQQLKKTQAQLIQTEKMSSLGQLVAGIAHEINNPISFIRGNITHAQDYFSNLLTLIQAYQQEYPHPNPKISKLFAEIDLDFLTEDLARMLTSIQAGSDRIRNIVLSLRTFSRLDESEIKPVNIHESIESTLMILQSRLYENLKLSGIQVVKNYGDLPLVECYASQLNQVFMNLFINAIDALEQQSQMQLNADYQPTLTISTEYPPLNHGLLKSVVLIRICDNGAGMNEEIKRRIFDPFFTTKPVGKGTGLGLAISYQIVVEQHHGTLECQSVLGKGTEFLLTLPVQLVAN